MLEIYYRKTIIYKIDPKIFLLGERTKYPDNNLGNLADSTLKDCIMASADNTLEYCMMAD